MSAAVIEATTEVGKVRFKVADPPTPADLDRWATLASYIPDATWTGRPGGDLR